MIPIVPSIICTELVAANQHVTSWGTMFFRYLIVYLSLALLQPSNKKAIETDPLTYPGRFFCVVLRPLSASSLSTFSPIIVWSQHQVITIIPPHNRPTHLTPTYNPPIRRLLMSHTIILLFAISETPGLFH